MKSPFGQLQGFRDFNYLKPSITHLCLVFLLNFFLLIESVAYDSVYLSIMTQELQLPMQRQALHDVPWWLLYSIGVSELGRSSAFCMTLASGATHDFIDTQFAEALVLGSRHYVWGQQSPSWIAWTYNSVWAKKTLLRSSFQRTWTPSTAARISPGGRFQWRSRPWYEFFFSIITLQPQRALRKLLKAVCNILRPVLDLLFD